MSNKLSIVFLISISLHLTTCVGESNNHAKDTVIQNDTEKLAPKTKAVKQQLSSMTDPRDGATYSTITIGNQTWMAENLRYNAPGSMLNPDNPSNAYGRLYPLIPAQDACPPGWHLPSDQEWEQVEIAHGMPSTFIGKGGWRGKHGTSMKSTTEWDKDGNGTNLLGFNILPAGYYFSGRIGEEKGMQGLGFSAAFWSSRNGNVATARFLFSPKEWINKWEDKDDDTGAGLSCRCLKNVK